jgi:hypothetical protein
MLFRETVAVYCENHTEHISKLYGKNTEFSNVEANGIYIYHCAVEGIELYKTDSLLRSW